MDSAMPILYISLRSATLGDEQELGAGLHVSYGEEELREEILRQWLDSHPVSDGWQNHLVRLLTVPADSDIAYEFSDGRPTEYFRLHLERVPD